MGILDRVRVWGRLLLAVVLLVFGGLMALLAVVLAVRHEFVPALAGGVIATVPFGPGVVMAGEAVRLRRAARDPLASLHPVESLRPVRKTRRSRLWSTLGRLCVALWFLSLGLAMALPGVRGLMAHSGVGEVLFCLLLVVLGVAGLGMGLSVLVNRGYWLWDNGDHHGGYLSRWRGSERRW